MHYKRGAADDMRKHPHTFLEWCVSRGFVDTNVLAGYRNPKQTRAERVGRRRKGRALTDDEVIKVWKAAGKLGTFGQLTRLCLLGGPRRSEPTMMEWSRHILDDRITFDEAWTKMGLHHDVPRTQLIDEVLAAAKHFQRATSDYVFPSPKTGGQMSGFTKMVARLIKEAEVARFTMHDLRRTLRTIMSRCGYDNEIQRLCVGQKAARNRSGLQSRRTVDYPQDGVRGGSRLHRGVGRRETGRQGRATAADESARPDQGRAARPSPRALCG